MISQSQINSLYWNYVVVLQKTIHFSFHTHTRNSFTPSHERKQHCSNNYSQNSSITQNYNLKVELLKPTKTEHTFSGWNESAESMPPTTSQ